MKPWAERFYSGDAWKDCREALELPKYLPNSSTKTLRQNFGTPENFKKIWRVEEEKPVTQEQFEAMHKIMMDKKANLAANLGKWRKWASQGHPQKA